MRLISTVKRRGFLLSCRLVRGKLVFGGKADAGERTPAETVAMAENRAIAGLPGALTARRRRGKAQVSAHHRSDSSLISC